MADEAVYLSDIKTTTNAIIASDLMDELIAIRDSFDINYWRLGDVTNVIVSQAIAQGVDGIKVVLYHRIGQIVGKSPRMVRYYAAVSGFYSQEIREKYQLLPFSHFAYAMKFRSGDDVGFREFSKCAKILDYALSNAEDYHGLPPSVASLRYKFENPERLEPNNGSGEREIVRKPADQRIPSYSGISVIDTFPISANGDGRNREDVIDSRRKLAIIRLRSLISEIVPLVQFLGNSVLSQLVSRLVENIRFYIEHEELGE